MERTLRITAAAISAILSLSCTKESDKQTYAAQESRIESFVSSQTAANESVYAVNNAGSVRVVIKEGNGEELKSDGTISFYYAGYVMSGASLSSQNLFVTNVKELSTATGLPTDGSVLTVNLAETDLVEGLKNGLEGVKGGEECIILFSGKHGFGNRQFGTIPANSALAYHIWVESISND